MMGFIIGVHILICVLLIVIILIQAGRGGGLVEAFSGVESMFGTKTSAFLTRATTILSTLFFITCIILALMAARQSRSLLRDVRPTGAPLGAAIPDGSWPAEEGVDSRQEPPQGPVQGPAEEPPVTPAE